MHSGIKILLLLTAFWVTLEASTSKISMENTSTCYKVAWCSGYAQ